MSAAPGGRRVRIKVLRYVWETGWPGAISLPPMPDREFRRLFDAAREWLAREGITVEFDMARWGVLAGAVHERLKDRREAIITACRRQADVDGVSLVGFAHVLAFVHEPPADTGVVGRDAVFDRTHETVVADITRLVSSSVSFCQQGLRRSHTFPETWEHTEERGEWPT